MVAAAVDLKRHSLLQERHQPVRGHGGGVRERPRLQLHESAPAGKRCSASGAIGEGCVKRQSEKKGNQRASPKNMYQVGNPRKGIVPGARLEL